LKQRDGFPFSGSQKPSASSLGYHVRHEKQQIGSKNFKEKARITKR
jgi:hypothetical protein